MKPGAIVGIIDHVALPNGDTRATVEKLHRIDPAVVKADFERAGFELDGERNLLRNPADDHHPACLRPEDPREDRPLHLPLPEAALTKDAERRRRDQPVRGGGAYRVLLALVVGLLAGASAQSLGDGMREPALQVSGLVGGLWLNALKMTVIPLVVALLVIGIAKGAEAARAGGSPGRTVMWIVIVCTASAIFGALMIELLTGIFPASAAAQAQALQAGLAGLDPSAATGADAGDRRFLQWRRPGQCHCRRRPTATSLPLVVFAMLFALA